MQNISVSKIEANQNQEPEKKAEKKLGKIAVRHSNFFITINTQKNVNGMNAEEAQVLKKKFEEVMDEFYYQKLKDFVIMKGSESGVKYGFKKDATKEELATRITKAKAEFVIEIGPEKGTLHSHGLIAISKRALDTKLDYEGIRTWFREKMGFEIHFKSILYRDAQANLSDYIRKTVAN